jgi:hypothetical protein
LIFNHSYISYKTENTDSYDDFDDDYGDEVDYWDSDDPSSSDIDIANDQDNRPQNRYTIRVAPQLQSKPAAAQSFTTDQSSCRPSKPYANE